MKKVKKTTTKDKVLVALREHSTELDGLESRLRNLEDTGQIKGLEGTKMQIEEHIKALRTKMEYIVQLYGLEED